MASSITSLLRVLELLLIFTIHVASMCLRGIHMDPRFWIVIALFRQYFLGFLFLL